MEIIGLQKVLKLGSLRLETQADRTQPPMQGRLQQLYEWREPGRSSELIASLIIISWGPDAHELSCTVSTTIKTCNNYTNRLF